jgi:hypothetical protein
MIREGECKMTATWKDGAITVEFDGEYGVFSPREIARVSRAANRERRHLIALHLRGQRKKEIKDERRQRDEGFGHEVRGADEDSNGSGGDSDEISRLAGEILDRESELSGGTVGTE